MSISDQNIKFIYVVDGKAALNYDIPDPSKLPTPTTEEEQMTSDSHSNMLNVLRSNPIIVEWIERVPVGTVWNGSYFEVPQVEPEPEPEWTEE